MSHERYYSSDMKTNIVENKTKFSPTLILLKGFLKTNVCKLLRYQRY